MTSLKKLLAVASLSLPLAASAQPAPAAPPAAPPAPPKAPLVQVYGTLNVNLQYTETTDATAGSAANVKPRMAVSVDSSNVGVRGSAEVAHGLSAVYQCETAASIDGEDLRAFCNRNSRVGLSSTGFGTLFYGNWDTPYKALTYGTKADDPFGNTDVFGFQGLFGSPGFRTRSAVFQSGTGGVTIAVPAIPPATAGTNVTPTVTTSGAGFDIRAGNSVAYWSPKFAGVTARVQYSVNEWRGVDGRVDPQLLSAGLNYDVAGLSVAVGAEYHEDMFGIRTMAGTGNNAGTQAAKDLALKAGAGYELPIGVGTVRVMAAVEQLNYQQDNASGGTSLKEYSRLAWLAGATFRTGNHEFRARYTQALDPDVKAARGVTLPATVEDDLGAQQYALGYSYHLAKSTQVFAFWTQIANDKRATYTFGVGGAATVVGTNLAAGADPMAGGLGIRHAF